VKDECSWFPFSVLFEFGESETSLVPACRFLENVDFRISLPINVCDYIIGELSPLFLVMLFVRDSSVLDDNFLFIAN
jgi:hypothetical protein